MVFRDWEDRSLPVSDKCERRIRNSNFRRGFYRNPIFMAFQNNESRDRVWRQLDDIDSWRLYGILEVTGSSFDGIFKCIHHCWNRICKSGVSKKYKNPVFTVSTNRISGCLRVVNRTYEASTTVEMAYLMPVILLTWMLVIFALFYYHDKNIIAGAAYETAIVGSEQVQQGLEIDADRLYQYYKERIGRKMLFFPYATAEIAIEEKQIKVIGSAYSKGLKIEIEESAAVISPEKKLRKIEMIKNGLEEIQ